MKPSYNRLSSSSTNRRKFLKTTATLAGMTMLGSLDLHPLTDVEEKREMKSSYIDSKQGAMITIRGHHLFDMLEALRTGKESHKTLGPIAQKIRANPKTPLKIVVGMDDICSPCEWWDHNKMACVRDTEKHPRDNENDFTSDRNVIRMLGMKAGEVMNADDIYRLIKTKVTKKVFIKEVCVACRLVNDCSNAYEQQIEEVIKVLS
jgi:hypothetical protein